MRKNSALTHLIDDFEVAMEKIKFGEASVTVHIKNGEIHLSKIATINTELHVTGKGNGGRENAY